MRRSYGSRRAPTGHPTDDVSVVATTAAVVAGTVAGVTGVLTAAGVAVALAWRRRRPTLAVLVVCAALIGALRGAAAWEGASPRRTGAFVGWAEVVGDPAPRGAAVRVTLEIEGERFDAVVGGSSGRRAARLADGDLALVGGRRRAGGATPAATHRQQVRHVVGRFALEVLADVRSGSALTVSANRVRRLLRETADTTMAADDAALFTGLVVGDDSRQSASVVAQFRAAGLSHLCAVSGQNVAFFLAALTPVLRRLRPTGRALFATAAIGWFCLLTRLEASVLRAGVMAVTSVWATWSGRTVAPVRMVALAVSLLVVVDPMLVRSVGFWLSVGATVGVSVLAPFAVAAVSGGVRRPGVFAVTLGAQVGVAVPSLVVFGRLPVLAVPANLVAGPVAGVVMLWGFPAAVLQHLLPGPLAGLAVVPCSVGTRWVAAVAAAASATAPGPWWNAAGWAGVTAVTVLLARRMRRSGTRVPS